MKCLVLCQYTSQTRDLYLENLCEGSEAEAMALLDVYCNGDVSCLLFDLGDTESSAARTVVVNVGKCIHAPSCGSTLAPCTVAIILLLAPLLLNSAVVFQMSHASSTPRKPCCTECLLGHIDSMHCTQLKGGVHPDY